PLSRSAPGLNSPAPSGQHALSLHDALPIFREGVHSGASGIVPSTFRVARELLSRLEDPATGEVLLPAFHADIPEERVVQAGAARSEEHTSELQSRENLVCRLLLEKKKTRQI